VGLHGHLPIVCHDVADELVWHGEPEQGDPNIDSGHDGLVSRTRWYMVSSALSITSML
jgi:hypothetical protein